MAHAAVSLCSLQKYERAYSRKKRAETQSAGRPAKRLRTDGQCAVKAVTTATPTIAHDEKMKGHGIKKATSAYIAIGSRAVHEPENIGRQRYLCL
jgi:hypothetical protein